MGLALEQQLDILCLLLAIRPLQTSLTCLASGCILVRWVNPMDLTHLTEFEVKNFSGGNEAGNPWAEAIVLSVSLSPGSAYPILGAHQILSQLMCLFSKYLFSVCASIGTGSSDQLP